MKLTFNIDYRTNWGEQVFMTGNIPELGHFDRAKALPLISEGSGLHSVSLDISPATGSIEYRYFIVRDGNPIREEWGKNRVLRIDPKVGSVTVNDRWQDQPWNKPFFSTAFTDCICRPAAYDQPCDIQPGSICLMADAPMVLPGTRLAVSGSCEALGNWDPAKAVVMNNSMFPRWSVQLPLADLPQTDIEYKFLLLRESDHTVIGWDNRDNRILSVPESDGYSSLVEAGLFFENPLSPWRGAGVAIPVFSLRSDKDFGVGDFLDLKLMVDWTASTGQKMIQLLPVNDTTMTHTWADSYPYNANSCFALHPMYLRVQDLGELSDRHEQSRFDALARTLNELREVDYERVNAAKTEFTRLIFAQQGRNDLETPEFKKFFDANVSWLKPYAAFCVLRDLYHTADPSAWEQYSVYAPSLIERFVDQHRNEIDYIYYIQFHLDRQLREVRDYAHSRGVALKGDIPIGISRTSVDAWISPRLFNLDCSAGAPPDDFSVMGQNWGLPTYNWEEMAKDGFAWWKARFRKMAEYFDAYRIDHVLGFFRIWQIPSNALHGLLGVFNRALPMSPDEMKYGYDFHIDTESQTRPFITDQMLGDFFGELADEVRATYLQHTGYGRYQLLDRFSTQRRIADHFASSPRDEKADRICNGLLSLVDEVLFIEDPYEKGKYHPRIAAQFTYAYRALNEYERGCYDRLYNDFFYHRNNDFWREKALWKLPPIIDATDMLVCAEDLGMIPACVPDVMHRLEILSLEIQRMPKDPSVKFADTWHYPYLSVCTTSTHDMGGIRQWWEENRESIGSFYNNVLGFSGEAPYFAEPWICSRIVDNHLKSPSMLCILPLQDWLSTDGVLRRQDPREEQINVPANSRHYWRYRMHLTLEQLLQADSFNRSISHMIAESGR